MRPSWVPVLMAVALFGFQFVYSETNYTVHPQAWVDFGRIMHAEDTLTNQPSQVPILNYSGQTLQTFGAQLAIRSELSDGLRAGFGFGIQKATHAIGNQQTTFSAVSLYQVFISEARLTIYQGDRDKPKWLMDIGFFPFIANPDVQNLGLYLLRGPVYPGILMGGFGDFYTDSTKATLFGARLRHHHGRYSGDLVLNCELDVPPTFDWSVAYLGHVQFGAGRVGAGIQFHRLLPYDPKLEIPGKHPEILNGAKIDQYIEVDRTNPAAPETTFFSHQGIKLNVTGSLDLKRWIHLPGSHFSDDWKLYGEAALIGVTNYGRAYGNRAERIPVMMGFHFPTWGLLNHLSLEVEYYGARYRNDLALVGNNNLVADWTIQEHPIPSAKPPDDSLYGIVDRSLFVNRAGDTVHVAGTALDKENLSTDDWKWSLHAEKIVAKHIQFVGQIANDHYRPRPVAVGLIKSSGGTAEAFASPKDWYCMFRVGFLF